MVECLVRLLNGVGKRTNGVCTADAHGDAQAGVFRKFKAFHRGADAFQLLFQRVLRHIVEEQEELVAAVADQLVAGADRGADGLCHAGNRGVLFQMA